MGFFDATWYCNAGDQSTTGYYAVTKWATGATIAAGALRRQLAAPAVGGERVFVAIVGGTTHATTEPAWVITRGGKTTDNTVTWQECTGASAVNGDATSTPTWTGITGGLATVISLGAIIRRNNGASYWICSTAGTTGTTEPAWPNDTAGTTRTDGTVTWTCIGAVGNFTGGQAPHARLANACATNWFADGNTIYVGDNHAETSGAAITLTPSSVAMAKVLCHNHSGSYPPAAGDLTTGATISLVANGSISINAIGSVYFYGLTFKSGVGAGGTCNLNLGAALQSNINNWYCFDNCSFWIATTGIGSIGIGSTSSSAWQTIIFNNCTVKFAAVGQFMNIFYSLFIWQNTGPILVSGSSIPAVLFKPNSAGYISRLILEAIDLSQCTGLLFSVGVNYLIDSLLIKDCKLNAAAAVATPANSGMTVQTVRSDSGATAYKSSRYQYEGTETTETSITRVGGATDPTGQAQSRKIVTTANSQWLRPFNAEPYAIWNAIAGSNVTVTVYGTINAGALPNNDDIWLEVEYLGSALFPIGTIVTTTKANLLAANAAVSSDSSTWNGGGSGAGWMPFKLTTTLSSPQPGMVGYLHARVRAGKPGTTYYIDPKVVLT